MSQAESFFGTYIKSFARSGGLRSLRQQLLLIAGVLVAAALILMGTSLSNLQHSLLESEAAERTILEITTIETRLVDYAGNLATLIQTGDKLFEKRLIASDQEADLAMRKLRNSLRYAPAELADFQSLGPLFKQRNALAAQFRAPGEVARLATARAIAATDDAIRGKLWKILLAERNKRLESHARMIAEARKSFWLAIGIVTFTFLISVSFFWLAAAERPATKNRADTPVS